MLLRLRVITAAAVWLTCAASLGAQTKRLTYVRDTSFNFSAQGFRRLVMVLVAKDGRMIVAPEFFSGTAVAFDSTGKKLPWALPLRRGDNSEVWGVSRWGWVGDSVWVVDPGFRQIAMIGRDGKVAKSIGFPSWVRPFWRDRRKYPLFSQMQWQAMYDDGTLLVEPSKSRRLLDTPEYDRSQKVLVRVDRDGRILRTVARAPEMEGRMQLRSGTERRWVSVPNFPRTFWQTSADGERIAVVTPLPRDSGAFRVTMLSDQGDTVFSKRYVVDAARVSKAATDGFLATVQPFGRYTAQQIRDTIVKQMAAFHSPIVALHVGVDHSTWIWIRRPTSDPQQAEWFVIDAKGEPVGVTVFPRAFKMTAASLDRVWTVESDRVKQTSTIVRLRRADARAARPTRSARASASSSPARPRE